jgi:hypothetical protein
MKTLINISILFLLFCNFSFPQFYADSVTPDYIIEFMNIADTSINDMNDYKRIKDYPDSTLEQITELFFKCYDENPVGFYGYVEKLTEPIRNKYLESRKRTQELMPIWQVYYLRNQIANKYGIVFTEVISTPAFLKCKYVDDNLSFLDTARTISTSMKVYYYFLIEEVVKGEKFFKPGDTIVVNSVIGGPDNPRPILEKTKSYLVPIKPFILNFSEYNGANAFDKLDEVYDVWAMGQQPKTFPIENEIIKNCEYFGIKDTNWIEFKKYFKEKYLVFD